ncbi:MAG: tripartite tricarboxylate transporter substrate binding protein [Rhizobiales bacterium]|nr:tripartite tricarboxylate transporter substrate binding protein [Hyphomicrobiales bacterium]
MLKSAKWAVGLLALVWSCASFAQNYPSKPVRIIVPYQAGQGTDVVARYFADHLSRTTGQRFYIENKPGAGGNIGTEMAAHSEADGYTILMGTNATQTMNEFMYTSLGFAPDKDFAPIILVGKLPMLISASPSFKANSVAELVAAAKATPDKVDMALPSTTARIVFEFLKEKTGAPLFSVPYKGSATALTDVLGGQVPLIVDTVTALRSQIADGKLKALGITSLKSTELMPGVKSIAEQGVTGFEVTAWNAFYAPRDTPQPVIDLLNAELAKALALPETRKRLLELGFDPAGGTPAELAQFEKQERAKWGPIIKATDLKGG